MKKKILSILLGAVLAIALIGCGSPKSTSTETKEVPKQEDAKNKETKSEPVKEKTKVTYDNFMKIQMGEQYNDVVALLGEGRETSSSEVNGIKTVMYQWNGAGTGNLSITIQNDIVTEKAQAFLEAPNANITMDLYNKVQNGMKYDQAKEILGEGELSSQTKMMGTEVEIYSYINKDGSNAEFTFTNGSLDSKVQANLK